MISELVILSGKGGTGKTSLTAAFCQLADGCVVCDGDVDAADLHLLLAPKVVKASDFIGGSLAMIDLERCSGCGRCVELCRFGAISADFVVDSIQCEGCGVCVDLCPEQAIDFPKQKCGEWFRSTTPCGPMVHARLGIGEENSGKLVSLVRQQARAVAEQTARKLIIIDGPPGIGCPVIASLGGATGVLIVVEPTLSGLHDLERVIELTAFFRVPAVICINKYDLNLEMTAGIEARARQRNLGVVGKIPFDSVFVEAMVDGKSVMEFAGESPTASTIEGIWREILTFMARNSAGIRDMSTAIT